MKTIKQYLSTSSQIQDINENIRNRSSKSIRNNFNRTYQMIQRETNIENIVKLNADLLQLTIELLLREK